MNICYGFGLLILLIVGEILMGRALIPARLRLWGGTIDSSRQLFDWYSPSHLIHGIVFYWLTGNVIVSIAIEVAWELLENSPFVINRYRETSSVDYTGDTVINSLSDATCMVLGFYLTSAVPWHAAAGVLVFFELFTLWAIRDNLLLNVIMLIYPFERIKQWQLYK